MITPSGPAVMPATAAHRMRRWLWCVVWLLALSSKLAAQRHSVHGFVYDSIAREPLAGATVQVMLLAGDSERPIRRSAVTDSSGRYDIADVPGGTFVIGFFHPKLDSLGIEAPVVKANTARSERDIDMAVPSARSVVAASCGPNAVRDSSGFVAGYVLRPETRAPRDSARVLARWSEIVIDESGARAATREALATTTSTGWFGICGVPQGALVLLRVVANADTGSYVELELPDHGILLRPLFLGSQPVARVAEAGMGEPVTVPPPGRSIDAPRGTTPTGRIVGSVHASSGEPLPHAVVRLWGTAYSATSNEQGEFAIVDLPSGTHTLEARSIGYVPSRVAVDVFSTAPARVDLTLSDFPTVIDTVRVMALRPRLAAMAGSFEYRRQLGFGTFLDADQIERRMPHDFTDLLRGTRGVMVSTSGVASATVEMQGNSPNSSCEPLLVIDGQRVPLAGMNINVLVPAGIVRALEIYPRRMEAPPEYQTVDCGSIVVWTGPRGWLAKRPRGQTSRPRQER